jgi:predicted enzyme related to lactoylglutathione lyase
MESGRLHPLKDPSGAVMGVGPAAGAGVTEGPDVWHAHLSLDPEAASQVYARTFDWRIGTGGVTGEGDRYQPFGWSPGDESAGSFLDSARRPGVHTQWLFFFAVDEIDQAADRVRQLGGTALASVDSGAGTLLPCDDPQGAAFGLWQRPRS